MHTRLISLRSAATGIALAVSLAISGGAHADQLVTNEIALTSTNDQLETSPVIGSDALGEIVVYTSRDSSGPVLGPGDIWMQRVNADGSADGAPVRVSNDSSADLGGVGKR